MTDPPAPSTIVATVPRWLGRPPIAGETVLVGLTPMDEDHLVCLALNPERDPMDEVNACRQLVIDGAEQVAILQYTGVESAAAELILRFLATAAARYQLNVIGVLVVVPPQRGRAGYWRAIVSPPGGDTVTRNPIPTPTEETS